MTASPSPLYDAIVVGAGPAGITAAVYLARQKIKTLILTKDVGGQVGWSADIENYPGFVMITGPDLVDKLRSQLEKYKDFVELKDGESVKGVRQEGGAGGGGGAFVVESTSGAFRAKTVVVASGKLPRELGVAGEKEFKGKGVTYCAICDAPLYRNKAVAVIGGGNSALDAALQLEKYATRVYVVNIHPEFKGEADMAKRVLASPKIETLFNTQTTAVLGDQFVKGIAVKDKKTGAERTLDVQGVFVEIGSVPSSSFLDAQKNQWNEILVDENMNTKIPGLFAAGDVTQLPEKQLVAAAGQGSIAALKAIEYLNSLKAKKT